MAAGSIDRRVARTRRLLQAALFELTTENGYAAVTVADICARADVGRSTFYTHYPDKDSLRKTAIEEHLDVMRAMAGARDSQPSAGGFVFSGPAFAHADATRTMHLAMLGGKKHEIPEEVRGWIDRQVRHELADMARQGAIRLDAATHFVVGAFLEVMHWWLDEETQLSPAAVDQLFQSLAFEGMSAVLAKPHDVHGKGHD
ncbi:TetR/AcrR family transcriptional regulator [Sphingosinicella sp. LHD-64]|uniref:TetR/AcrR family transcriptional regulator n=1 Tax=Sphingosinicella sp. LHD-64 TaxID=3072139 RepID=UPI00280FE2E7|nr:TetR/AcrR family transcriptional regulator [Sphingosinicella sp. LHD-64]MDQ8757414.1 TetR/AcrR family transcriptional regulator [Sphingosinicella sp. LHD-64]